MKHGIPDKTYYLLLDYKDKNLTEFWDIHGRGIRLADLTVQELYDYHKRVMVSSPPTE